MRRLCFSVGCLLTLGAAGQAPLITYDSRVLDGDPAPGTDAGVVFAQTLFSAPVINNAGHIAFSGVVQGPGTTVANNQGLWSGGGGTLELIAREGSAAPGTPGGVMFRHPRLAVLNDAGQTFFISDLTGPGVTFSNDDGIWIDAADAGPALVARIGDAAPGVGGGARFTDVYSAPFGMNASGRTAFAGAVSGSGVTVANDTGLWSQSPGVLTLIAREGQNAPGTDTTFAGFGPPILNSSGHTVFTGLLSGFASRRLGLWRHHDAQMTLIFRQGNQAPGQAAGVVFDDDMPGGIAVNSAGDLAFATSVQGPGVDAANRVILWSLTDGLMTQVLRSGDAAPGAGPGVVFGPSGPASVMLNNAGQLALMHELAGDGVGSENDMGLWAEIDGALTLVARTGEEAPGTEPLEVFAAFDQPTFNNAGQMAFMATLDGLGVGEHNDDGLWVMGSGGELTLIARESEYFDIDSDPLTEDLQIIQSVEFLSGSQGDDGRASAFNDHGQVAYRLTFEFGRTGIFVASLTDTVAGDITGDGFAGAADLDILLANWGDEVGVQATASGDLSGDGVVGQADLDLLIAAWGEGDPPAVDIPEPGSVGLLSVSGLAALRRRVGGH